MTTTLRVSESTRLRAAALARQSASSIGEVVERALDAYERSEFWRQTRQALARESTSGDLDRSWDRSLKDGLHDD